MLDAVFLTEPFRPLEVLAAAAGLDQWELQEHNATLVSL